MRPRVLIYFSGKSRIKEKRDNKVLKWLVSTGKETFLNGVIIDRKVTLRRNKKYNIS